MSTILSISDDPQSKLPTYQGYATLVLLTLPVHVYDCICGTIFFTSSNGMFQVLNEDSQRLMSGDLTPFWYIASLSLSITPLFLGFACVLDKKILLQ
jgi:hypothetical protein